METKSRLLRCAQDAGLRIMSPPSVSLQMSAKAQWFHCRLGISRMPNDAASSKTESRAWRNCGRVDSSTKSR